MARKKTLDAAIDEVLKDYKTAMTAAVEYASDRAVEDIWKYSLSCLEEYYNNYDPESYKRTDSLWHAFVPYLKIDKNKTNITSTVGVEYDASLLNTYVVGSKDYGMRDIDNDKDIMPINEWILDNYLNGIHPATDGTRTPGEAVYFQIIDPVSPTQKMNEYINKYVKTFDSNLLIHLASQVAKKLK